jgi:arylsulfatase
MVRGDGYDATAAPGSADAFLCLGPGWSRAANTPFRRHKKWTHEGGIATPFIVHWPAGIAARGALRSNAVGHVIDISPTILALAGGSWPDEWNGLDRPPIPGRDLSNTLPRDEKVDRTHLWWLHEGNRAVREGDWKLVSTKGGEWEVYDLAHDRMENQNCAAEQPERVKHLGQLWQKTTAEFEKMSR